jgi:hypothetical protein
MYFRNSVSICPKCTKELIADVRLVGLRSRSILLTCAYCRENVLLMDNISCSVTGCDNAPTCVRASNAITGTELIPLCDRHKRPVLLTGKYWLKQIGETLTYLIWTIVCFAVLTGMIWIIGLIKNMVSR